VTTPLERSALVAAFIAAVVAVGLTLSLVTHVEGVTLTVFASGIALGPAYGALVGAAGMTVYVFANTAVRGFPPSPLPLLAAQALGMTFAGIAGGWWRRWWQGSGRRRRLGFLVLPILGALCALFFQVVTNAVFAFVMSDAPGPRLAVFLSGMSFGLIDILTNAVLFGLAGPGVASVLRRMARERGWWVRTLAMVVCLFGAGSALASPDAPPDSSVSSRPPAADTVGTPTPKVTAAPVRTEPLIRLRRMHLYREPLWKAISTRATVEAGGMAFSGSDSLVGMDASRLASPGIAPVLDPWALGWGRARFSYDGFPLRGPVHGFDEPPDLPLAWRGQWVERVTAAGAEFGVDPFPKEGPPESQISITTGGYGRRTTEFGLFRLFGSVALGADFLDRIENGQANFAAVGLNDLNELDHTRFWLRLARAPGRRPDWSVDVSTGGEDRKLADGGSLKRASRRVQLALRGPFWGGETRVGAQLRRQSLRLEGGPNPFGEVLFDGFTLQADWAGPWVHGLSTRIAWDRDRRRGLFDPETFDGVTGTATWTHDGRHWGFGADATVGYQEPFAKTWRANASVRYQESWLTLRAAASHDEDFPGLIVGVDRPAPQDGLEDALRDIENSGEAEERSAALLETELRAHPGVLVVQGWVARMRHYRIDNNPLWSQNGVYAPVPYPSDQADFVGVAGRLHLNLPHGFYGEGQGRIHSRDETQVPYEARWTTEGALHWRGWLFKRSLDLDLAAGGLALGTRRTPLGDTYPTAGTGYLRLRGHVDNGVITASLENALDAYMESDVRSDDFFTPFPVAGRTFYVGLTFYLTQ
jgi:hypothetical protein